MAIAVTSSNITKSSNSIEIYQGESKDISIEITQEVPNVNNVPVEEPVDLTGSALYFSVRSKASSPEVLIEKNSSDALQIEILTPLTGGVAVIHLVPDDTKHINASEYVFDVWIVLSSGKRMPVVEISAFVVKEPVTKID